MIRIGHHGGALPLSRRAVLYGVGASVATALVGGCGGSNDAPAPPNPQPRPAGAMTDASVSISSKSVGFIPSGFAGFSYEKSSMAVGRFAPANTNLISMLRALGPSLLRIGGNSVDRTHWAPTGAGRTTNQVAPSDIDALGGFLRASGWQVLYGVNLAASTPSAAAAEVAYAAQSLGSALYGIEIGNECDVYGNATSYFPGNWNLQDFVQLWGQFRTTILAAVPDITITGPASASHETTWTIPFAEQVGKQQISLLTQHYYRGNGQLPTSTEAKLISPDPSLVSDVAALKAAATQIGIPFRMTEANSFYNGGASGVSNSYASALWVLDHLFDVALGGGEGVNLHGGGSGPGYTPIADNNGVVLEARPEYYGVKLFTLAGPGPLLGTTVSASGLNVTAYAVLNPNSGVNLIVVNKDLTQSLSLTVDLGQPVNAAQLVEMTGTAIDASTGVTIQGASIGLDGTLTPQPAYTLTTTGTKVSCYVNALSAALITVS